MQIELIQLPVGLWAKAQRDAEDLRGEMRRLSEHFGGRLLGKHMTPVRFNETINQFCAEHSELGLGRIQGQVETAGQSGEVAIDTTYLLPDRAGPALLALWRVWDDIDEYCRENSYALLATRSDCKVLRDWFFQQCLKQLGGTAPTSWTDYKSSG